MFFANKFLNLCNPFLCHCLMRKMETLKVVVDRGSGQEDRDRRMEKLKTRSTPDPETDIRSEISLSTPKLEQTMHLGNKAGDDEVRRLMDLALYRAAKQGDVDVFINALEKVANEKRLPLCAIFDQVSPIGSTYCHIAANFDNVEIVELIAHHFPTLITRKDCNGDTALHLAARAGHRKTMEILLKVQKDVNNLPCVEAWDERQIHQESLLLRIKNEKGNTALHEALVNSQVKIANHLIKEDPQGAFYLNNKHESPLSLSAKAGSKKCVSLILSFQEELERMINQVKAGKAGKSPVHEAISSRNRDVLGVMLSKEPQFLRFTDEEGRFPLHYAAAMGYVEEVSYLLDKFSIYSIEKDKNGLLPVHWASTKGKVAVIKKLLLHCLHPEQLLDQNGRSILHFIAKSGQTVAVDYVLKDRTFEGLINMKDKQGNTPLHLAAEHFHHKVVNRLIWDSRAKLELLNDEGMTALDVAEERLGDPPTWRQRLTWGSLKAARVPRVHPGKILNIDRRTTTILTEKNKSKNYKDRVNTLLLVSTLVATITFAAGFTMPGGYNNSNPDQGMATLVEQKKFQVFILCDTIALYSSITVAVALIWGQLGDVRMVHCALRFALPLLGIALGMMSLAFMAGVSVVVSKLKWLDWTILAMGVTFISIVSLIFFPLWFPSTLSRHLHCIFYNPVILPIHVEVEQMAVEERAEVQERAVEEKE